MSYDNQVLKPAQLAGRFKDHLTPDLPAYFSVRDKPRGLMEFRTNITSLVDSRAGRSRYADLKYKLVIPVLLV